ncbi:MAG: helix-turn-helix transcriptional regulator [Oscillospiraceae bacterium]
MELCGQKIAELRKASDMTQMELADKMNISFQAVSNWERGNSMPDISKLPELAEIFGVSIDDLIGSKSPLLDSIVSDTVKEHIADNGVTSDEIKEVVPIIKPSQAENIFENVKDVMDIKDIEDLLPFMSRQTIDDMAKKLISENKSIGDIVMFVSRDIVNELAISCYEAKGMRAIDDIAPFVSRDILKQIAEEEYTKNGLRNFETVAPFLDCRYLNHLAKQAIEKDGINAVSPIAPFLDRQMLSEFVREKFL